MNDPVAISVGDVRDVVNRILDAIERDSGPSVEVGVDYYWHLGAERLFDVDHDGLEPTIGQVSDDVETLRQFLAPGGEAIDQIWHLTDHLVGALRALGHARGATWVEA